MLRRGWEVRALGRHLNDIVDTASAIQISQSLDIVERDVVHLIGTLAKLAKEHRNTIMMGRTHGQFAIPTTFGFKIAGYITEMMRYQERIFRLANGCAWARCPVPSGPARH